MSSAWGSNCQPRPKRLNTFHWTESRFEGESDLGFGAGSNVLVRHVQGSEVGDNITENIGDMRSLMLEMIVWEMYQVFEFLAHKRVDVLDFRLSDRKNWFLRRSQVIILIHCKVFLRLNDIDHYTNQRSMKEFEPFLKIAIILALS